MPAAMPGADVSGDRGSAVDGLQGSCAGCEERHSGSRAGAGGVERSPAKLGDGRSFRKRDRGELGSAGGCTAARTDAAGRERFEYRASSRRLLLGRVESSGTSTRERGERRQRRWSTRLPTSELTTPPETHGGHTDDRTD